MSLFTRDYDYSLPEALIASHPLPRREQSRLMVIDRASGEIEHRVFREFPGLVRANELVVLNNTRVIPARLISPDRRTELLLLEQLDDTRWKCMARPGRRFRAGVRTDIAGLSVEVEAVLESGERIIRFEQPPDLEKLGEMPLPPYIRRAGEPDDLSRYQTVYAAHPGAVAAPTAGLHFTPEILSRIPHVFVTLHVGAGTFKPVRTERITGHRMHTEKFAVTPETASAIEKAGDVVAVGTTTVRLLESLMQRHGRIVAGESETDIFIHPGFEFRAVRSLLTNFHLPKSTLLMLVSAFAGRELVMRAYDEAIRKRYRFYSYGDCMFIR